MIGGHLYDIAQTPHGTRAPAGDAQGKGLPAIGTGVAVLSAVRETVSRETGPANVAQALNAAVERYNTYPVQTGQRERFVTATVPYVQDGPQIAADNCEHPTPPAAPRRRTSPGGRPARGHPPGPCGTERPAAHRAASPMTRRRPTGPAPWHADAVPVPLTDGTTEAQDTHDAFHPSQQAPTHLAAQPATALPEAPERGARQRDKRRNRDDVTALAPTRTKTPPAAEPLDGDLG
ncbi:SpoIIE family protein phosphatase [Kitasatospora sp. NPDC001539]|uniref:SpoIIE family protein phosphatase n=1 Tax=Kitasatospora sp. NPDC001539 TaxID=3154384 RepID=UPI0033305986